MKTFATTLTVLLSVAAAGLTVSSAPSLASDPLHLLAQVNHLVSQDAGGTSGTGTVSTPKPPKAPKKPKTQQ